MASLSAPVVSLVTLMVITSSHAPTYSHTARPSMTLYLTNSCALHAEAHFTSHMIHVTLAQPQPPTPLIGALMPLSYMDMNLVLI